MRGENPFLSTQPLVYLPAGIDLSLCLSPPPDQCRRAAAPARPTDRPTDRPPVRPSTRPSAALGYLGPHRPARAVTALEHVLGPEPHIAATTAWALSGGDGLQAAAALRLPQPATAHHSPLQGSGWRQPGRNPPLALGLRPESRHGPPKLYWPLPHRQAEGSGRIQGAGALNLHEKSLAAAVDSGILENGASLFWHHTSIESFKSNSCISEGGLG